MVHAIKKTPLPNIAICSTLSHWSINWNSLSHWSVNWNSLSHWSVIWNSVSHRSVIWDSPSHWSVIWSSCFSLYSDGGDQPPDTQRDEGYETGAVNGRRDAAAAPPPTLPKPRSSGGGRPGHAGLSKYVARCFLVCEFNLKDLYPDSNEPISLSIIRFHLVAFVHYHYYYYYYYTGVGLGIAGWLKVMIWA